MYRKVLVPLDGSEEAEKVLSIVQSVLAPEGEVILFHAIPPAPTQTHGDVVLFGSEQEEAERARALAYLAGVAGQLGEASGSWRCEVAVSESVAEGIAEVASREGVDLIAMYTHDRKGLARLIRGSIAEKVQRSVPVEVRVFKPRELAGVR